MKMNFIKQGTGDKLFAKTEFLHWGRTTLVAIVLYFGFGQEPPDLSIVKDFFMV
jgi:acyl-coenzyme A thioesterase PaaI-like protein